MKVTTAGCTAWQAARAAAEAAQVRRVLPLVPAAEAAEAAVPAALLVTCGPTASSAQAAEEVAQELLAVAAVLGHLTERSRIAKRRNISVALRGIQVPVLPAVKITAVTAVRAQRLKSRTGQRLTGNGPMQVVAVRAVTPAAIAMKRVIRLFTQ